MSHAPAMLPTLALSCVLAVSAAAAAQESPPPPPADGQPPAGEQTPPPPPAKYQSDKAAAWGSAPPPAATQASPPSPTAAGTAALKKQCADEKSKGLPLSPECQTAELDIVFQGAVRRPGPGVKAVPQAHDEESSRLHTEKAASEDGVITTREGKLDVWAVARREPPLLPEERVGFFDAGLNVGYSWLFGRGTEVDNAYTPVIHLGLEGSYQLFRLLALALVADFDYLTGGAAAGYELMPPVSGDDYYRKEVGAILDNYVALGLRPTLRFNVHFSMFEWAAGAGLGWHWFHTSGRWRTKVAENDPSNVGDSGIPPPIATQPQWSGGADEIVYSFEESDHGLYGVFETTLMARLLDKRVGAGLFLQYTLPIHGGIVPDVTVESGTGQENDYGDTFVRHLGSLSLLTLGLAADYRF
ncbi:MAG TPA: hypothetical protein VM389_00945 [Phycisphaerae bacterium]|nr:hypothetical protein [Phycisphaerae bacterium]